MVSLDKPKVHAMLLIAILAVALVTVISSSMTMAGPSSFSAQYDTEIEQLKSKLRELEARIHVHQEPKSAPEESVSAKLAQVLERDMLASTPPAPQAQHSSVQGPTAVHASPETNEDIWVEATSPVKPLWGLKHKYNGDAVFALAFGYGLQDYKRFVGSLRASGYEDDIVLATSAPKDMRSGVKEYLQAQRVLAYPFGFECRKKGGGRNLLVTPAGCILTDWYEGGDQRDPRPLAVIRYEHYKTWASLYSDKSWMLILDFRDTFFQLNPFDNSILNRHENIDIHLYEENRDVKRVGICPFNSGWLRCWGREYPKKFANNSVVCSGSTLGSKHGITKYVDRMIQEMDSQKCHLTGIESDQGYHNYLFDTGKFAEAGIRIAAHPQGTHIVNTVGAMNGFRVPADQKGPLGAFWKARDEEGFIINWDQTRSPVVHQWDRFAKELLRWVDRKVAK